MVSETSKGRQAGRFLFQTITNTFTHSCSPFLGLSAGPGPFPGVIDLFGGSGGLIEFRAVLLANKGFAVLALAFFGYDDLPQSLEEVDLEYFEEASILLLKHPKVCLRGYIFFYLVTRALCSGTIEIKIDQE